jgi:hypothetical protein
MLEFGLLFSSKKHYVSTTHAVFCETFFRKWKGKAKEIHTYSVKGLMGKDSDAPAEVTLASAFE